MLSLGTMTQVITVLSHSCIGRAPYPSSYSNQPGLPVFRVLLLAYSKWSLLNQVGAAVKISAGGVGSP